jgi:formate transporter
VAAGFEHCVANMYFIPLGIMLKQRASNDFWEIINKGVDSYSLLTWKNFIFVNLLPVTIGNIVGGSLLVGLVYWFVYIRRARKSPFSAD